MMKTPIMSEMDIGKMQILKLEKNRFTLDAVDFSDICGRAIQERIRWFVENIAVSAYPREREMNPRAAKSSPPSEFAIK
tara:strand:+ start:1060 stop:1296 length:237 start_codon:yes stop_codon:yes gene_type:complete